MSSTTGLDAAALEPTGPDDLVAQLNLASGRTSWWPGAAIGVFIIFVLTAAVPPAGLAVLLLGAPAVVWLAFWERARRTVVVFYDVAGPRSDWYEQLTSGFASLRIMHGAWRIVESGAVRTTHQHKVNSGASNLVSRVRAFFTLAPPREFSTNVSVPTLTSGHDTLLFLPDRVLMRSARRWSDASYEELRLRAGTQRFIETEVIPGDSQQVGTTWQYVNVSGGPDRRFSNNRQLPIMLYGELEITTASGLRWLTQCSSQDAARWLGAVLVPPRAIPSVPAPVKPTLPTVRTEVRQPPRRPFAEPRHVGPLFAYAGALSAQSSLLTHDGPFAIVDVETTGFSPTKGDRMIEIAIARVGRTGLIEDEYATLLNPGARDTGAVYIHGITNESVRDAPTFSDVSGDILSRLDGCVVVAHNASFEEQFLLAELARSGISIGPVPALCTLWLARETCQMPNHKLGTLANAAGLSTADAHTALGDVRLIAGLLMPMLNRLPGRLGYPCMPLIASAVAVPAAGMSRPRTRVGSLRRGTDGWMSSILARLPLSAVDAGNADGQRYLDLLSDVVADGRIVEVEARTLATLAGTAGFGSSQVAALNQRFLESMREAAFEDNILTATELKQLNRAAKALGVPEYFDDLSVGDQTTQPAPEAPQAIMLKQRRCGNCRDYGHNRSACPVVTAV